MKNSVDKSHAVDAPPECRISFAMPPEQVGEFDFGWGMRFGATKKPCWWYRMWYRFFLGWKWIDADQKENK